MGCGCVFDNCSGLFFGLAYLLWVGVFAFEVGFGLIWLCYLFGIVVVGSCFVVYQVVCLLIVIMLMFAGYTFNSRVLHHLDFLVYY